MKFVHKEPKKYAFVDRDGHSGKIFGTDSDKTNHLIIECKKELNVVLMQQESEFNYYILKGSGVFTIDDVNYKVDVSDLVVIPPKHSYTFSGDLKMLLINTPHYNKEKETVIAKD